MSPGPPAGAPGPAGEAPASSSGAGPGPRPQARERAERAAAGGRARARPHPRAEQHKDGAAASTEPSCNGGGEKGKAPSQEKGAGRRTGHRHDWARPLPSPTQLTHHVPHRRIPAPRLQLLLLLTAHDGGSAPDLHRKETAELFPPEPQRPHQPHRAQRHKMAAAGPPGATASALPDCTAARREGTRLPT